MTTAVEKPLQDKVAVVTGGGLGIGRAHCLELAAHGATVVIVDPGANLDGSSSGGSPAQQVVSEIEAAGGRARAIDMSVTDFAGVGTMITDVVDEFGSLDVVVNNAGITRDGMIATMDESAWDAVIAVHLKGTFNLIRHAGAHWRTRSKAGEHVYGRIINTTSGAGMRGNVGQTSYSSAKAAIATLTVVSSMELSPYGVTVNAISPVARTRMTGAVDGFLAAKDGEDGFDPFDPANSSPVVAYLASPEAQWISGQIIRIDGNQLRFYQRWSASEQAFTPSEDRRLRFDELDTGIKSLFGVAPLGLTDQRLRHNS